MILECASCGQANRFDQPYLYHAGFADVAFLYNVEGNRTLVWSLTDPAFVALLKDPARWTFSSGALRRRVEAVLAPSPTGSRWLFANPARCGRCGRPVARPMLKDIHYVIFPGSVDVSGSHAFGTVLRPPAGA